MNRSIVVFCVLGMVSCTLCSCRQSKFTCKVGQHKVEIIERSILRSGPLKSGHTVVPDGASVLTYDSRMYSIRLEGEVLAVNGTTYIIPRKDDAILIENGQVAINGQTAKPQRR